MQGYAAITVLGVWAGLSLLIDLPPAPDALFGPAHLSLAVEAGAALALLLLWHRAGLPGGAAARWALAVLLLLIVLLRLGDMVTGAVGDRPFNPVVDLRLAPDLVRAFAGAAGWTKALLAVTGAALGLGLLLWGLVRLLALAGRALAERTGRRAFAACTTAVLALAAVQAAAPQVFASYRPVTASAAALLAEQAARLAETLARHRTFAAAAATDRFAETPPERLLARLGRGDVLLVFVESYGVTALSGPPAGTPAGTIVLPVLERAGQDLAARGFGAVSGTLVSPTFGGGSWLAHATMLSGLWIDDDILYRLLLAGQRRTLVDDFRRAGYRTVAVMPAITRPWPEGLRLRFERIATAPELGYAGPPWYWGVPPDQYTLDAFERRERGLPGRPPLFATMALITSHAPWTPEPEPLADWDAIGDGRSFVRSDAPGETAERVWRDPEDIRRHYARSVAYSLTVLFDYIARFVGPQTLVVILGDHQPATLVSGPAASHAVPVHVVSGDTALLAPFRGWGFADGMLPDPDSAARGMDAFRDWFLAAFSAPAASAVSGAAPR